jgi:L-ascorbate metabolism protein UlaG (beta-lactamase superfamily)
MKEQLQFRWLGTAGIELETRGERVLIDPYLSRFPFHCTIFGRPVSRRDLVARYLSSARAVLVSHSHFDHLLDVPSVCREFGAAAYGSANTSAILRAHEIPPVQIRTVTAGDHIAAGPFAIRILPGLHGQMLGVLPFTGRLPARLQPPLRLSEYRMDAMFSFHVSVANASVLIWNGPKSQDVPCADVLFFCPLWGARACAAIAQAARARIIVPIHWDNFFSPLDRPLRPLIAPPGWGSPWVQRMDPDAFARSLNLQLPGVQVHVPEIFSYVPI